MKLKNPYIAITTSSSSTSSQPVPPRHFSQPLEGGDCHSRWSVWRPLEVFQVSLGLYPQICCRYFSNGEGYVSVCDYLEGKINQVSCCHKFSVFFSFSFCLINEFLVLVYRFFLVKKLSFLMINIERKIEVLYVKSCFFFGFFFSRFQSRVFFFLICYFSWLNLKSDLDFLFYFLKIPILFEVWHSNSWGVFLCFSNCSNWFIWNIIDSIKEIIREFCAHFFFRMINLHLHFDN